MGDRAGPLLDHRDLRRFFAMKPLIELWDAVGMGLVIEWPSGVLYSNQTGGTSCLQPRIEGVFVPLRNDCELDGHRLISPEAELIEYFEGPRHQGAGATRGLSVGDAGFIDSVLVRWRLCPVKVDLSRLSDSHEAWVHVILEGASSEETELPFHDFHSYPRRGILTWSNSD